MLLKQGSARSQETEKVCQALAVELHLTKWHLQMDLEQALT